MIWPSEPEVWPRAASRLLLALPQVEVVWLPADYLLMGQDGRTISGLAQGSTIYAPPPYSLGAFCTLTHEFGHTQTSGWRMSRAKSEIYADAWALALWDAWELPWRSRAVLDLERTFELARQREVWTDDLDAIRAEVVLPPLPPDPVDLRAVIEESRRLEREAFELIQAAA